MVAQEAQTSRKEDNDRDLGFGAVVARESQQRLLNPDGTFNVARRGLHFWSSLSLYHALLTMAWWKFLSIVTAIYFLANVVFAIGYLLCGPGALNGPRGVPEGRFLQAFFFSVQTFATIGYGHITPSGLGANIVVTIESLVGLLGFALATGMLFARFSRPTAKIVFSESAIVAPYKDMTAFEFRIINARSNQIIELQAKVIFSQFEKEGAVRIRRFYPLNLERDRVAFFPLSWTIVHPIDETSPLSGTTREDLLAAEAEFLILLTGIDETFSQTVHTRSSYQAEEVLWHVKFSNIFGPQQAGNRLTVDIMAIHKTEPARSSSELAVKSSEPRLPSAE